MPSNSCAADDNLRTRKWVNKEVEIVEQYSTGYGMHAIGHENIKATNKHAPLAEKYMFMNLLKRTIAAISMDWILM